MLDNKIFIWSIYLSVGAALLHLLTKTLVVF